MQTSNFHSISVSIEWHLHQLVLCVRRQDGLQCKLSDHSCQRVSSPSISDFRTDPTRNARSQWKKTPTRPRSVRSSHSSAIAVENASRRRRYAMVSDNVPTAKTKRSATSESRGDVRPTRSRAARVNACPSTSSATQSFRAAMEVTSRRISADPRFRSSTPSKDPRASRRRAATATVR